MKKHLSVPVAAWCVFAAVSAGHAQSPTAPAGRWEGQIEIPGKTLGLTVDIDRNAAGAWIGTLTIPMTTTADVPIDRIGIESNGVHFEVRLPGTTTFEGTLSADGQQLSGL